MANQPVPRNWSVGELVTAAQLNTHVRDSTEYFLSPPHCFVTGVGTTNAGDQTIPNNTWTAVTWQTEVVDTEDMHSVLSNTELVTIKVAGCYAITGQVTYNTPSSADSGVRGVSIDILRGGSLFLVPARTSHANSYGWSQDPPLAAKVSNVSMETVVQVATYVDLQIGDQVRLMTYQNTGGNLNLLKRGNAYHTFMSVLWIGAL